MLESDENNQNREARRQNIGRKIWTSMLDADLNAKYWGYIGKRQFKKNRRLKIALAIVSVSTVAFSDFINSYLKVPWQLIVAIAAVIAYILPILNWEQNLKDLSTLTRLYTELQYEFENLWADIEVNDENLDLHTIEEGYNRARQKQQNVLLVLQSFGLPDDEDLIEACYREVLSSRDLDENQS